MDKEVSFKFSNKIENLNKLEKYSKLLSQIQSISKGIDKGAVKEISEGAKNVSGLNKEASKTDSILSKAFSLGKVTAFVNVLKSAVKTIGSLTDKSSAYTENLNLYAVAFDGATESADKFVNKLTEMYGLDESWLVRTTGIFKQLSNAMALSTEQGTKLATLMTQMSVDISSLYNIDIERASSVLQSSLAGQTKPIRGATGADITQNTLQTTLDGLGIDRYIGDLSYAEKRLVIIISLTQQLKEATNDFGKTIESPANQMRILDEQWQRLSRSVGNLFLPVLAKVLPYLNAVLMVLTEIINTVASLLGFDLGEYDYGVSGVTDSVLELEDSLNGATSGASKLKKEMSGLRSFDKLNVIKTPTSAKASGGAGGAGGISPDIMKAFNTAFDEYNSKLENVRMKANDIRDSIMGWLGFTKKINPLTGDISWEYQGISKTLKNMWESFKKIKPEAKIILGYFTALFATKMFNMGKKIVSLFGNSGLLKWIVKLNSPFGKLLKDMKEYVKYAPSLGSGIKTAIDDWQAQLTTMEKVQGVMAGIVSAGTGMLVVKTSMDSINESGLNLLNTLGLVGGGLSTVIGGVQIGATLGGGTGAIIGGVTGAVATLIESMLLYETEMDKMVEKSEQVYEATKKENDILRAKKEAIQDELNQGLTVSTYHTNLLNELKDIVDANGNIKKGYEDRATFIVSTLNEAYGTEMTISDGVIKKYQEQIDKIEDLIETKKANIILTANEKAYALAIENQATQWKKAQNKLEAYNTENEKHNDMLDKLREAEKLLGTEQFKNFEYIDEKGNLYKGYNAYKQLNDDVSKHEELLKNKWKTYQEDDDLYREYTNDIIKYDNLQTAILTGNKKEIEKAVKEYTETVKTEAGNEKLTGAELLKFYRDNGTEIINAYEKQGLKVNEITKKTAYANFLNTTDELTNTKNYIDGCTDDFAISWGILGDVSKDEFLTKFKELPSDLQRDVISKMEENGIEISEELQKGIDEINPTVKVKMDTTEANKKIKVDADVSSAQKKTENLWTKVRKALLNSFSISLPALNFAKGGLPPVGQLFVANERGPELVGHIGGQSFVANQNQMMDLLDKKIGNSGSGVKNATFVINVGSKKIAEQVLTDLEDMAKSNGKPITING